MISECVTKSSITADTAFRKILSLQGCTTFCPHVPTTLNACTIKPLPMEAGRGWMATLYSCAYLSMIHQAGLPGNLAGPPNSGTYSKAQTRLHITTSPFSSVQSNSKSNQFKSVRNHQLMSNGNLELEAPWIDILTLVVL